MSKHGDRIERLRAQLETDNLDAFLVSQPESRFYLSGYTGHDLPPRDSAGYLVIGKKDAFLLTDPRTSEQAEYETSGYEVVVYSGENRMTDRVKQVVQRIGATRVGFESIHLPHAFWAAIQAALAGASTFLPIKDLVDRLRVVKDSAEMKSLQAAIDVLDECFIHVARNELRAGRTELQVAAEISRFLDRRGYTTSFPSIVASGTNASMPHAVPTERVIREGEPITIDIGALVEGYCSDMTRTVCIGEPSAKLREVYALVLEAQDRAEKRVRVGMTGVEADALARDFLKERGHGEYFTHGLGHGIGLEVHEPPSLSLRGEQKLETGMVFSVEPGIYQAGWGGVRIEDLVRLEDSGAKILCRSPKALELSEVIA
ncbi:MAG: Xaa-Pro peptidase family protein [Chloroflexota bacterium]